MKFVDLLSNSRGYCKEFFHSKRSPATISVHINMTMTEVGQENKAVGAINREDKVQTKDDSRTDENQSRVDTGIRDNGVRDAAAKPNLHSRNMENTEHQGYPPYPGYAYAKGPYDHPHSQPYYHPSYGPYMGAPPYQYGMVPYGFSGPWDNTNSSKKRSIDGVQGTSISNPYAFRRSESNSTTSTSTTTVGNNTSLESYLGSDGNAELPALNIDAMGLHDNIDRKNSTDDSASTLSVGGFSLGSSEGPKGKVGPAKRVLKKKKKIKNSTHVSHLSVGAMEDDDSSKRQRTTTRSGLSIDTSIRPPSIGVDGPHLDSTTSTSTSGSHPGLFLSLSTSPINTDLDATPLKKNTSKSERKTDRKSIFKQKISERATPLFGKSSVDSIDETLNRHLRGQTFTPLPNLNTHSPNFGVIAPQLSWTLTGDSESIGDIADWMDDKLKGDVMSRPNSTTTVDTKNMSISPHNFELWKEDNEETGMGGSTTPLPPFFTDTKRDFDRQHPPSQTQSMQFPTQQMNHGVPPTPMFHNERFHRSPHMMQADMYPNPFMMHSGHHHDRVHNLRGRIPHGYPPMPVHMPHPMQPQFPMTSPMGGSPAKPIMWSPHNMQHMMASAQHMGSPLGSLAQSKRKCVPLKPPIPPKFQGDMESSRNATIPEFTNLVNFPANISQKQQPNVPEGMRCCVMCGKACPCSMGGKKGKKKDSPGTVGQTSAGLDTTRSSGYGIIPSQNKGLCTMCDVNVWIIVTTGLQIKWCKGCKNFRPWACFGEKGLATKCLRCRDRQREKYALQKEEKERSRSKDNIDSVDL